jgi:hypothetical protein
MRDRLNRIFARETGQPLERIEEDTHRNFWLSAETAVRYGLVGRIISRQASWTAEDVECPGGDLARARSAACSPGLPPGPEGYALLDRYCLTQVGRRSRVTSATRLRTTSP